MHGVLARVPVPRWCGEPSQGELSLDITVGKLSAREGFFLSRPHITVVAMLMTLEMLRQTARLGIDTT